MINVTVSPPEAISVSVCEADTATVEVTSSEEVNVEVNADTVQLQGNVWFGTRSEYNALPVTSRNDTTVLHCIREGT